MILIFNIINIILQKNATIKSSYFEPNKNIYRGFLDIYEKTKGGKIFFSFILMYMFFSSIILPIIHYYNNIRSKNYYFQDVRFKKKKKKIKKKKKKNKIK